METNKKQKIDIEEDDFQKEMEKTLQQAREINEKIKDNEEEKKKKQIWTWSQL